MEQELDLDKLYFTIGEVAKRFRVSTSLIRYWEDEFPHIAPRKNAKGDRRYSRNDIEKVRQIYDLIKEKRYTIEGAKAFLAEKPDKKKKEIVLKLEEIKSFLQTLRDRLD